MSRNSNLDLDGDFSSTKNDSHISLNSSFTKDEPLNNSNGQLNFFSTSTPMLNHDDKILENHGDSGIISNSMNSSPLNEKVASLASSVYTELEKIVKLYGRETVKDLMSILVNILEALDFAYQEKEEQIVENELLKDDYEKLLLQYEREKQARKDTELKLFQSEDSFAEQKRDYEEKVVSLESIVRMIDLKSKNTADHVQRLEEKENELKREYTKLHERYTELFKTHCDYMDRTKILFGNENRADSSNSGTNLNSNGQTNTTGRFNRHNRTKAINTSSNNSNQLLDMLNSTNVNVNRTDLINVIKSSSRTDINIAINNLLASQDLLENTSGKSNSTEASNIDLASENSSLTINDDDSSSSESGKQQLDRQSPDELSKSRSEMTGCGESLIENPDGGRNMQISENFDEHIRMNIEFDDTASEYSNMNSMTQKDFEEEEEMANRTKNDLSLYNELSRDHYDITELDDGADLTGMSREVANLIRENSELLQTKHALNVLKDDLIVRLDNFSSEMVLLREELKSLQTIKACLQLRISELEEEAKKYKEDLAEKTKKQEEEDENVPMSQRKRFTRAEMARVLMERNQYKERLMDLQEAVRWTEMMRASKVDSSAMPSGAAAAIAAMPGNTNVVSINGSEGSQTAEQQQEHKKKTPMWKFFSDLFGSSSSSQPTQVSPVHAPSSNEAPNNQLSPNTRKSIKTKVSEPTETDTMTVNLSEKAAKAYEFLKDDSQSKSIQIRQIDNKTSLVVKEDGRMQAYGWSLPSKSSIHLAGDTTNKTVHSKNTPITVPVPVYCRPLFEHDNNLKMSCSSTINFSFDPSCVKNCGELIEASPFSHYRSQIQHNEYKSSCIWICNLNENNTHVSVLDANKPGDLIEQFILKQLKIYCIQSISGASQSEFPLSAEKLKSLANNLNELNSKLRQSNEMGAEVAETEKTKELDDKEITFIECESDQDSALGPDQASHPLANTSEKGPEEPTTVTTDQEKTLTSLYPTMWLGSQEGWLLVHSTVSKINKSIDKVKLKDAILSIVQSGGRVIVGLANGSVAVFNRNSDGLWDLKNYFLINIDRPHHSIRCVINVNENIWCGIRNKIFVLNPTEFKLGSTIEVHPRKENQVRHMAWINDGVWVSLRLDSTLRLYHAKTLQHLQYVDIEPFITRMLGSSNLGQSMVRISSLLIAAKRLWIGTGNGVILSLPFNESAKEAVNSTSLSKIPGTGVRVSAEPETETSNNHIPYCNLTEAQFSFHGHRNSIKFFLNVPIEAIQKMNSVKTTNKPKEESYEKFETMLVLSGGHGYIDFRIGDNNKAGTSTNEKQNGENQSTNKHERSHLIVWQLNNNN